MYKQTKKSNKSRNWTEIAQDIGLVLRKQLMERRNSQMQQMDLKKSAIELTRSLAKAPNLPNYPVSASGKMLFQNKKIKTQQKLTLKLARETFLTKKESTQSSNHDFSFQKIRRESKIVQMQNNKKLDAHKIRIFLGRLKQEKDFHKLMNQREKTYKIWRLRADKIVANNASQK